MLHELAQRGWVCVAINYRLSPKATWPDHIVDCKRALAWVQDHIAEYGGDPSFVAVSGGSAGGHLSALAALTPNAAEWQPGFEDADTSVDACIPFYGVHDMTGDPESEGAYGHGLIELLERRVMKLPYVENTPVYDRGVARPTDHTVGPAVLRPPGDERHPGAAPGGAPVRRPPPRGLPVSGRLPGAAPGPARLRHPPVDPVPEHDARRGALPRGDPGPRATPADGPRRTRTPRAARFRPVATPGPRGSEGGRIWTRGRVSDVESPIRVGPAVRRGAHSVVCTRGKI